MHFKRDSPGSPSPATAPPQPSAPVWHRYYLDKPPGSSPELDLVPVSASPELDLVPVSASPELDLVPVSASPELDLVPVSASPELDLVPVSASPELDLVPVSACPSKPVKSATRFDKLSANSLTSQVELAGLVSCGHSLTNIAPPPPGGRTG
ncbi:hypothetical protein EGW08_007886 [Elysia chlorotica]|uniref:Uncharacterized protein n=1 Tax=Elysia chlorotica TaxID=188477 RepID=A0A3S1A740_ELYCH|nr:hypothetical protein EGW08_007886 [Elysia chlorotica]